MDKTDLSGRRFSLWSGITVSFRFAPVYTLLCLISFIISALIPTALVGANAAFINNAITLLSSPQTGIPRGLVLSLMLMIGLMLAEKCTAILSDFCSGRMDVRISAMLSHAILRKKAALRYRYIEERESLDLISRVSGGASAQIGSGLGQLLVIAGLVLRVAGVILILAFSAWWAALALCLFFIPFYCFARKSGAEHYEADKRVSKLEREEANLDHILSAREHEDERFLFRYSAYLSRKWRDLFNTANEERLRVNKKWMIKSKAMGIAVNIASFMLIALLIPAVAQGSMSTGILIALTQAIMNIMSSSTWELNWAVDSMTRFTAFAADMQRFFSYEEAISPPDEIPIPDDYVFECLEFRDVSFAYPDTERPVLEHLSFTIRSGTRAAFVGVNGAGKSTIIKLLCGMYDTYSGEILINGTDLRRISVFNRRKIFSVVFQDFARYGISAADNIALGAGDASAVDTQELAKKAGVFDTVSALPQGFDTRLGKIDEDSLDLSGGEWQKIAIARCLASASDLYILDEPTAALDPVSESSLYRQFDELTRGKTSILISHRLGATKTADLILVLSNGAVIESGSHADLMEQRGLYADMFESQRMWYE